MAFLPAIPFIIEGAEAIIVAVEAAEVVEGGVAAVEVATAVEGATAGGTAVAEGVAAAGGTAVAEGAGAAGGTAVVEGAAGGAAAAEGGGAAAAAGAQAAGAAQLSLLRTAAQVAQWVARQIAEFEAFDLGMQAVEKAIAKLYEMTKSPEAKAMDDIVKKFITAIGLLDAALKDWSNWMAANFDKGASFGTIQAPHVSLSRFDVFRNRIGTLFDIRQKQVSSAAVTASKTPTLPNYQALQRAAQSYATEMDKLSEELMQAGSPLAAGGLNGHLADIQSAKNTLA